MVAASAGITSTAHADSPKRPDIVPPGKRPPRCDYSTGVSPGRAYVLKPGAMGGAPADAWKTLRCDGSRLPNGAEPLHLRGVSYLACQPAWRATGGEIIPAGP